MRKIGLSSHLGSYRSRSLPTIGKCPLANNAVRWRPLESKEHKVNLTSPQRLANLGQPLEPLAYSIAEACRVSSLGRTRVYQLINEGKLQVRKIGKRTLIPAASLRALIDGEA